MRTISNQKYEITDMVHEEYPFLHRIRALRDICGEIHAGDIGGFVESESNLKKHLSPMQVFIFRGITSKE